MAKPQGPRAVLVTGAGGNLGSKLVAGLVAAEWCETIFAVDVKRPTGGVFDSPKVKIIVADLTDATDTRWHAGVEAADGIAHFAVNNPMPDGNWDDTVAAIDITANLLEHAKPSGCRFTFASSNHTMGGYKDLDWAKTGKLTGRTPPLPGTRYFVNGSYAQPNMYGGSKLTGERLLRAKALASGGRFTGVSLRIGWCLPGDGDPHRIDARGGGIGIGGSLVQPPEEAARDLRWFRSMWLSNRDFVAAFEAALTADPAGWPEPAVVVNAMSANRGSPWDLEDARNWLGYVPQDDVWRELGIDPP